MRLFFLNQLLKDNLYILDCEPINYRWGGFFNYSEISLLLNDYIFLNLNIFFLKIKKIILIIFLLSFKKSICVFFFLNFYKRFFLKDLFKPKIKFFYIVFIDKIFFFLTRFKFCLTKYKDFKLFSNYLNPRKGSSRFPTIVFISKKCWKNYKNFFFSFLRLRLISIKSNSIIGLNDNAGYNIFIKDCKKIYFMFKSIYLLTYKYFKTW